MPKITKIHLTDSMMDILIKMSEGNPGALTVCLQIIKDGEQIDPDHGLGGIGIILKLDTLKLYGPKIWMLYKDVCDENLSEMIAVLRGWQLGFLNERQLQHAVDNYGEGINLEEICAKVCERLPRFKLTVATNDPS